jgi:four helix bundle protein
MKKSSVLRDKRYKFATKIVRLAQLLQQERHKFALGKQLLRRRTSVGALIREAEYVQSNADFVNKFSIDQKETNETDYRLNLLKDTDFLEEKLFDSIDSDCNELVSVLSATIKTLENGNGY